MGTIQDWREPVIIALLPSCYMLVFFFMYLSDVVLFGEFCSKSCLESVLHVFCVIIFVVAVYFSSTCIMYRYPRRLWACPVALITVNIASCLVLIATLYSGYNFSRASCLPMGWMSVSFLAKWMDVQWNNILYRMFIRFFVGLSIVFQFSVGLFWRYLI